jgi:hypothetical protein
MRSGQFFSAYWREQSTEEIDDIVRAFNQLPATVARKHLAAAVRRSVAPFRPALRKATPVKTGNLSRSVKAITKFGTKMTRGSFGPFRGTVIGIVGYSRNGKDPKRRGNHSTIVEDGTKERFRKDRRRAGKMPARHMLRDTLNANKAGILAELEMQMGAALENAARDLAVRSR